MTRQHVRQELVLVAFLFMPVAFYLLSPVLILAASSQGWLGGSALAFAALFVSALFLGRGWCGWVCPAGGLQEACIAAQHKPARGGRANWI